MDENIVRGGGGQIMPVPHRPWPGPEAPLDLARWHLELRDWLVEAAVEPLAYDLFGAEFDDPMHMAEARDLIARVMAEDLTPDARDLRHVVAAALSQLGVVTEYGLLWHCARALDMFPDDPALLDAVWTAGLPVRRSARYGWVGFEFGSPAPADGDDEWWLEELRAHGLDVPEPRTAAWFDRLREIGVERPLACDFVPPAGPSNDLDGQPADVAESPSAASDPEPVVDLSASRRSRLKTAADRRNRPAPEWAVEEVIPEWGVGQMFGRSYSGKTYVAVDLALRFANGLPDWFGHALHRPGAVVFVLMEGVFDIQERVRAWMSAHPGCTDERLYTLEEEAVDLADVASVELLVLDIEALDLDPALVVIDTQALATPGTNENDNSDMGLVMSLLKGLAARLRCPVITVHHTGHENAERSRGASAVFAALDFQLRVDNMTVAAPKVKAGRPVQGIPFEIRSAAGSAYAAPLVSRDGDVDAAEAVGRAARRSLDLDQQVLDLVASSGEVTIAEAAAGMGTSKSTAGRSLRELVEAGLLERVQRRSGTGGRPADRFRLVVGGA